MNSIQGITNIAVGGFKSLYEECSIEIRPLTILAGANSSGKSSMMQPLLLMKQTLEAPYDPGFLLLNGPHVKVNRLEQLFSSVELNSRTDTFSVSLSLESNMKLVNQYTRDEKNKIYISRVVHQLWKRQFEYAPMMSHQEIADSLYNSYDEGHIIAQNLRDNSSAIFKYLEVDLTRNRCFLNAKFKTQKGSVTELDELFLYNSYGTTEQFSLQIIKTIHVPSLRDYPERSYPTTAVSSPFPGTFEQYVASLIKDWQESDRESLVKLENSLNKLGLTSKIESTQINDVQVELRVSRLAKNPQTNDMVNIADVGIGVSQVLPVLVSLLVAEPGQLVYIEQPELHLHPRAQIALGEILADAAKRGVRVVIETHSALLLLAIQTLVAEEKLAPDLVKLHWFSRREDGVTEVNSADLDETGAYGDWPEDFGDISLMLDNRYLSAAEAQLWRRTHGS